VAELLVCLAQTVHVAQQEPERTLFLEQLVHGLLEGAHVRQARQPVALGQHLEPLDQLAVALRVPADQCTRRGEGEQADRRRDRDHVE
jgi:hypothetical protein